MLARFVGLLTLFQNGLQTMRESQDNSMTRRQFLLASAVAGGSVILPVSATAQNSMQMPMPATSPTPPVQTGPANVTLRIATGLLELAPDHIVSTTLYNGQFPGPLLRFKEGQPVTVDIVNKTDHPELLHWHGQKIPSDVDGAEEEGSHVVAPGATLRETFAPGPSGFRF